MRPSRRPSSPSRGCAVTTAFTVEPSRWRKATKPVRSVPPLPAKPGGGPRARSLTGRPMVSAAARPSNSRPPRSNRSPRCPGRPRPRQWVRPARRPSPRALPGSRAPRNVIPAPGFRLGPAPAACAPCDERPGHHGTMTSFPRVWAVRLASKASPVCSRGKVRATSTVSAPRSAAAAGSASLAPCGRAQIQWLPCCDTPGSPREPGLQPCAPPPGGRAPSPRCAGGGSPAPALLRTRSGSPRLRQPLRGGAVLPRSTRVVARSTRTVPGCTPRARSITRRVATSAISVSG